MAVVPLHVLRQVEARVGVRLSVKLQSNTVRSSINYGALKVFNLNIMLMVILYVVEISPKNIGSKNSIRWTKVQRLISVTRHPELLQ